MEHQDERPIKTIWIKYQSSRGENIKLPIVSYTQKGRKISFDDKVGM